MCPECAKSIRTEMSARRSERTPLTAGPRRRRRRGRASSPGLLRPRAAPRLPEGEGELLRTADPILESGPPRRFERAAEGGTRGDSGEEKRLPVDRDAESPGARAQGEEPLSERRREGRSDGERHLRRPGTALVGQPPGRIPAREP